MRDILITLIVLGAIPYVFSRPYIGILLWAWIGYMNPHRLSYGFAYSFPFALIIAVVTVVSLFTSREKITFKYSPIIFLIIVFIVWMNITTFFALIPDDAWIQWKKVMKIQIMTLISYMVITNRHQLNSLVAVIAFSIGYYGVKGGAFTILTGGNFRV
ncbi:MAG: putative O-glycosylation ligase, exosortase A system-associated, partial [Thiohalomonadales bacterium]